MVTNRDIVVKYLNNGLISTCIDCQFARMDLWKKQYKDDMMQDLLQILLEYDNDKLNNADSSKHMNALITKMLVNNLYSQTSPFFKKYIRFNTLTDDIQGLIDAEDE